MKYLMVVALLPLLFLSGCSSDDEMANITITLIPTINGAEFRAGDVLQTADGRNFSVEKFHMMISEVFLVTDGGERVPVSDLELVSWPTDATKGDFASFDAIVPKEDYQALEFYVGLDSITNSATPTDYEASHPLSAEQDMHWGMLKYRFFSMIGEVDTSAAGDNTPANPLVYHLGRDELYSPVRMVRNLNITGVSVFFSLDFDVDKLFSGTAGNIDIKTDRVNHSGLADMPNARIVMSNLVEALEE